MALSKVPSDGLHSEINRTYLKATGGFYHGAYGYWKTRDNTGGSEFVVEYDTSPTMSDANIKFKILSSGYVQMPYQLHWSGSIGHSSGSGASGVANQSNARNTKGLSFSNSRITVPVSGTYAITFQTICANTSGRRDTGLQINGVTLQSALSEDNGSGFHQRTHAWNIHLSTNDYIQFYSASWYNVSSTNEVWQTASVTLLG